MGLSGEPDYTVVVPIKDEEESLPLLVKRIQKVLQNQSYELILVDDGSTDQSLEVIKELAKKNNTLRYISLDRNYGLTTALAAGFSRARAKTIITLDGDLQNAPEDIPLLLAHLNDYDLVIGYRANRMDSTIRRISSRIASAVRNWVMREDIIDVGCGLRALQRDCLSRIKLYEGSHRFLPTLFKMEGFRVKQIPVSHHPRLYGQSKCGIWNRLWVGLMDLLVVRWMTKRALKYSIKEKNES